ncbi:MAG TPA: bidirectional hydrogenase complex protein HoxU [Candidatus Acidoferrales bacterium]|nr:bidirectional hydrogenase complex protein HoxU [Candidatus Acidoferrales bacterium]
MTKPVTVKTFSIDEQDVNGRENQTVLEVARENNIFIPTLCQLDGLSSVGACRLCLVEIKGRPKLFPACTLFPEEGMEVVTSSERLKNYRRMIVELIFSERNHICSICVSSGHCELQSLAQTLGVTHVHFPYRYPPMSVEASHKEFTLDHNRCILCMRCVRVCDEIEGAHVLDVMKRGIDNRIVIDLDEPWGTSETCTSCGKCVQVCPTGALFEKGMSVMEMTKRKQFLSYLTIMREAHE